MGLPADSAALFQPWSGLRVAEDRGSFSAEKPQITPATEPDKASVRGSLPDRPCCSCQPQGPLQPKPVSRGPPLPGISASLFQRLKNRPADLSPPISSAWLSEVPEASGPKSRISQSSDSSHEENVKACASLGGIPDCDSRGVRGMVEWRAWDLFLEPLKGHPKSPLSTSQNPTLCRGL